MIEAFGDTIGDGFLVSDELEEVCLTVGEVFFKRGLAFLDAVDIDVVEVAVLHGPEHSHLKETGRAQYVGATDDEVLDAFLFLTQKEGIFPAFESAHAVAWLLTQAGQFKPDDVAIINLSGRGDKDVDSFIQYRPESVL